MTSAPHTDGYCAVDGGLVVFELVLPGASTEMHVTVPLIRPRVSDDCHTHTPPDMPIVVA
jgi:hypothetical protein